ncbi:MAG: hypothetical protein NTV18_06275 [Actinobacteria bacterium]|nr:hypothetical protein [Actinomycetota bacterium]
MLTKYGTEQVGISAELAVADLTGVAVADHYRRRGRPELVQHISPALVGVVNRIPKPTRHIAEDQNPIDFMLEGDKTLSVKSNMRDAGKIAPQNIGQPTSSTFWELLPHLVPEGSDPKRLSYADSAKLFKQVALTDTVALLTEYWKNLFDCDFLIYVYDVLTASNQLSRWPSARLFEKSKSPQWEKSRISFTQSLATWNESCTVKYNGVSIGEFQVHNNRNCFKFRFNISGLIEAKLL